MTITQRSINLIRELEFLSAGVLPTVSKYPEIADNISRYQRVLQTGVLNGDAQETLRAANLLSTVNKWISDREQESEDPVIASQVYALSSKAICLARSLRYDIGMQY